MAINVINRNWGSFCFDLLEMPCQILQQQQKKTNPFCVIELVLSGSCHNVNKYCCYIVTFKLLPLEKLNNNN